MKVLVTGNLGYVGPVVSAALLARGHEVHGFDNGLYAGFASFGLPVVARQTLADLRDERAVRKAIARCDAVVHLAAMSNDPLGELDPALTRAVNLDATLALIEAADARPLVLYSSASVYGVSDTPCDEDAAPHPLTLYSELKIAAERAALARGPSLVLRNGTVHGPAPIIRGDLLLNSMVASAVATHQIVLTTSPLTRRPGARRAVDGWRQRPLAPWQRRRDAREDRRHRGGGQADRSRARGGARDGRVARARARARARRCGDADRGRGVPGDRRPRPSRTAHQRFHHRPRRPTRLCADERRAAQQHSEVCTRCVRERSPPEPLRRRGGEPRGKRNRASGGSGGDGDDLGWLDKLGIQALER